MTIDMRLQIAVLVTLLTPVALAASTHADTAKMTPALVDHQKSDRQEFAGQYIKYGRAFNTKNFAALQQMLTPDCKVDVKGVNQPLGAYFRAQMRFYTLYNKVQKIVIHGATATVLIQEEDTSIADRRNMDLQAREDFWLKTAEGWRISHIHSSGPTGSLTF